MIITASQHEALSSHLFATDSMGALHRAPTAVHTAIAALIEPTDINGSHCEYAQLDPVRWRVWATTATHLAHTEVKFENEDTYDAEEEEARLDPLRQAKRPLAYRTSPARHDLVAAWTRPLLGILRVKADGIDRDYDAVGNESAFRLQGITVEFADGTIVPSEGRLRIPMQSQRAEGDSDRWEDFIEAIRKGSPYHTLELGTRQS